MFTITVATTDAGDHPREYGENANIEPGLLRVEGSSPRIRGKFCLELVAFDLYGIIPANTGKIENATIAFEPCGDHPREYGENGALADLLGNDEGSSPRIRGKFHGVTVTGQPLGIIPANTGKIVHAHGLKRPFCGSSPRIRGKCCEPC